MPLMRQQGDISGIFDNKLTSKEGKRQMKAMLAGREFEDYIIGEWKSRRTADSYQNWKSRIERVEAMYKGEWPAVWPGRVATEEDLPYVTNLVQIGMDDLQALVSETSPVIRCDPAGNNEKAITEANVREAIGHTYWLNNDYISWLPSTLAMDLAGSGAAFLLIWHGADDYPMFIRLDPRGCYPTIEHGRLIDLMVVSRMKATSAALLFPEIGIETRIDETTEVEVVDYYSDSIIAQHVIHPGKSYGDDPEGVERISIEPNPLGRMPIAWSKLETFDGAFRGIFDQVKNILWAQNRIFKLILDHADSAVYAPFKARNVANLHEPPGPDTIYQLLEGGDLARVEPNPIQGDLFNLLEYLEREGRAGVSYPATRQGDIQQAIASAAFVESTMGQLTTQVRRIQRHLQRIMSVANSLGFQIDEKFLNFSKPMIRTVKHINEYTPTEAINKIYRNRVVYGVGAGLDIINRSVMLTQDLGAGIISKETAAEQKEYILDPQGEQQKREKEFGRELLMQKMFAEGDLPSAIELAATLAEGKDILQAAVRLRDQQQKAAQAAVEAAQAEAGAPGAPPAPVTPEAQPAAGAEPFELLQPVVPPEQIIVAPPRF
jgi:hypothetical protein